MTYAAMIISDSDAEMTAANMTKVIKAAGASVDAFLPKLFCKTLEGKELKTFIDAAGKPGAGGGGEGGGQGRGGRGGGHGLRPLRLSGQRAGLRLPWLSALLHRCAGRPSFARRFVRVPE